MRIPCVDNPQCQHCAYMRLLNSSKSTPYCDYIRLTEDIPGYIDSDGKYRRDTYPCNEYKPEDAAITREHTMYIPDTPIDYWQYYGSQRRHQ